MNPNDQDRFDRLAGRVLRTSILGVRKITGIIKKPVLEIPARPARILIVKILGLGSLICASPTLAAIRRLYPNAEITLAASRRISTLYDSAGLYDEVIPWEVDRLGELPRAIRDFRDDCAARKFDLAICLDSLSHLSSLLTLVSGAPATAGFVETSGQTRGYTRPVPLNPEGHVTQMYLDLARTLGAQEPAAAIIPPTLRATELEQANETLRKWEVDRFSYYVGININTSETVQTRVWPPEKFILLAQAIEEMGEYRTMFFGAGDEERFVSRHVKNMDTPPINLAGRTSIRQLAALMTRLHLFITNDAGPLHLAAALSIPTVSLFCNGNPKRTGPPSGEANAVIWHTPKAESESTPPPATLYTMEKVRAIVSDMLEHLADPDSPPWEKSS